jgi:molecular chaperone IbpA
MRTYDFAPMTRSSIGFDRLFDLINSSAQRQGGAETGFPPYDIVKTGENKFRISIAAAGFAPDELGITFQQNLLSVAGSKKQNGTSEYMHRGITLQNFERQFSLADHVEVERASHENGILEIELVRNVPEAAKPRRIKINGAPAKHLEDEKPAEGRALR